MLKINTQKRTYKILFFGLVVITLSAAAFGVYSLLKTKNNASAYLDGFDPGNIMSDFVMGNKNTMTEAQINDFLHSKNPCNRAYDDEVRYYESQGYHYSIKDNRVLCMADDTFNGKSIAKIIWQAAQDYSINPQVLIVLLEKEQSLVTDPWPNDRQYAKATGFGCPDTSSGCDPAYSGLETQIRKAASLFREVLDGGWSNYPAYTTQFIYYNPSTSCGGSNIYIQNRATSALYRYTPYQPNAAALAAGKGTGDSCSSYGNRNFYNLFTEWFGSTQEFELGDKVKQRYNEINGSKILGKPINDQVCPTDDACWQDFENGAIIWHDSTGAWESKGGIRGRWAELGYQGGIMGYPTGPEVYDGRGWYQNYEGGAIIGTDNTGFWESTGGIRERWSQIGYQSGFMGYPTSAVVWDGRGYWQNYENGAIIGTDATGYWESKGGIRGRYSQIGFQNSSLGYPISPEYYDGRGWYQNYEGGAIIGTDNTGFWESTGGIRERWSQIGYQSGFMGYPTSAVVWDGRGYWQNYENGAIIGTDATGYWESKGGIRDYWARLGYQNSIAGYPTSPEYYDESSTWHQNYEHGVITYSEVAGTSYRPY